MDMRPFLYEVSMLFIKQEITPKFRDRRHTATVEANTAGLALFWHGSGARSWRRWAGGRKEGDGIGEQESHICCKFRISANPAFEWS